jgi:L-seryl-tRNA(Ser) seleniumtransferase
MAKALYRQLPKLDLLVSKPALSRFPHDVAVAAARRVLDDLRAQIGAGEVTALPDVLALVEAAAKEHTTGRLRPVINATGVVVHTNLGRAPWPAAAREAVQSLTGYCNLEMDLATGRRGGRLDAVQRLMAQLTGAEACIVVNNCAAAVLLALTALGRDREVIVSRGELVEIGGSFRVPEVVASGGAHMVEVGTTNRTHLADYEQAIGEKTAILLRVHTSNYRVVGFTECPEREQLVELGKRHNLQVIEDLGSGALNGDWDEPSVRESVSAGVDVVLFSGDKLLGGPQAGFAVGRAASIERLRKHPLYRALRLDKVILGAVEHTLVGHVMGEPTPVQEMLSATAEALSDKANVLHQALAGRGVDARVEQDVGFVGGGARPGQTLPTSVVVMDHARLDDVTRALRTGEPSVVARIADNTLRLDVRTISSDQIPELARRVAEAFNASSPEQGESSSDE